MFLRVCTASLSGKGLRATATIHAHTAILVERPIKVVLRQTDTTCSLASSIWKLTGEVMKDTTLAHRLLLRGNWGSGGGGAWGDRDETELTALATASSRAFFSRRDVQAVHSIVQSQHLECPLASHLDIALYDTLSNINHACDANAVVFDQDVRGTKVLVATRDLKDGDEITTCYAPMQPPFVTWSRDDRRALLRASFGFACACDLCKDQKGRAHYTAATSCDT